MQWYPIHPDKSLSAQPNSQTSLVELQGTNPYSGLSVSCYNFSLETMIDLQFSTFAETKGRSNVQYFLLELACFTPELRKVVFEDKEGKVFFERQGIGIRIGIASWNVSFSVASNVVAVAASASVLSAKTMLAVEAYGGNAINSLKPLQELNLMDGLNPEAMRLIGIAAGQVATLFSTGKLIPAPMHAASVNVGINSRKAAAVSMQFANERVYRGNSALDALAGSLKHGKKLEKELLSPLICQTAYAGFGIHSPVSEPTENQREEADRILSMGR